MEKMKGTELKKRILNISHLIPDSYLNDVAALLPQYAHQRTRIKNVRRAITADEAITEALEAIAALEQKRQDELEKLAKSNKQ